MLNFKKNLVLFLFLILTVLVSGCLRGKSEPTSSKSGVEGGADFRVGTITGPSLSTKEHEDWKVPLEKTYEFKACMISRVTEARLPGGQKFEIILPNKNRYEDKTDDQGCIEWQENVAFNFTGESVYIEKIRTLRGLGTYRGQTVLRLGVNPWAEFRNEATPEVIDLNRSQIADLKIVNENLEDPMRVGIFNKGRGANLFVEQNPTVKIIHIKDVKDGKKIRLITRLNPYILPVNMRGQAIRTQLFGGKFRIFAALVSNYVGLKAEESMILTPELGFKEVSVHESGVLSLQIDLDLKRKISLGQVQLALRIEPINSPFSLRPYEGLFNLGKVDSLFSFSNGEEVKGAYSNQNFSYSEFIKTANNFEKLKKLGMAEDLPPVYFEPLEPRFIRIASGETSTRRTIKYQVSTVVRDAIDGSPVARQPFKIKKHLNNQEEEKMTDEFGRLLWFDEISHLYYKPEVYFFPQYDLTQVISGFKRNMSTAINPWDEGWTFGRDIEEAKKEYKEMNEEKVRPPLLMVDAFRYQTIRFRYVIDEYMTLNVKKAVVMALDPLVIKFSIKDGRKLFEPLRDGIYLAKIALVKFYLDPFENGINFVKDSETNRNYIYRVNENEEARKGQYTTVVKKLLRVQAGRITTPLEFSMRDLRMMSIRSNIMVQLETIDEAKLLETNIIDSRMKQQFEDYLAYNSEGMTDKEKDEFIKKKNAEFEKEREELKVYLEKEIADLQEKREEAGDIHEKRHRVLSDLQNRLNINSGRELETNNRFKELMSMSREDYVRFNKEVRSSFDQLIFSMDKNWEGADKAWEEDKKRANDGLLLRPENQAQYFANEFDYLANLQGFMDEFDLGQTMGLTELKQLELNNYTEKPAAPFIDLDLYRNDSGLAKRTFIGPCTLVENDNMSEMRPTDNLDERETDRIDSSEELYLPRIQPPDNSAFEGSAYHDSLKPFADEYNSVDKVIPFHIENERQYERKMLALSQMGRFAEMFNFNYVSLKDKPIKKYINGCDFTDEESCFETKKTDLIPSQKFIQTFEKLNDLELLAKFFNYNPMCYLEALSEEIKASQSLDSLWGYTKSGWGKPSKTCASSFGQGLSIGYDPGKSWAKIFVQKEFKNQIPKVDLSQIKKWIAGGVTSFHLLDALRICQVVADQSFAELKKQDLVEDNGFWQNRGWSVTPEQSLLNHCISKIKYIPHTQTVLFDELSIQRKNKIIRTGQYEHKAGKNMNLNVGVDFSLTNYSDLSTAYSASLGTGGLGALGSFAGPVGGVLGSALGGTFNLAVTNTRADGANMSQTANASLAAFLVVQKAEMEIEIEEHEKCLTLQASPSYLATMKIENLNLRPNFDQKKVLQALSKGLMLCSGEITKNSKSGEVYKIKESYYYITQHFTAGDMLDDVNLLNHVWLLALRGDQDFNSFLELVTGKLHDRAGKLIKPEGTTSNYPLVHLNRAYRQVTPSFPGMYTVPEPHPMTLIE